MPRSTRSGPVISLLLSLVTFLSLLQLFDPLQHTSPPSSSAVERGLADFKAESSKADSPKAKDRIAWLLQDAGVTSLSQEEQSQLPQWQQVIDLYGDDIILHGQEHCEIFRQHVPPHNRILAVAGLFNTGTNLLHTQFTKNIHGVKTIWQVPWGKHRMAQVKWDHTAHGMEQHNKKHVLPLVMLRDPLAWMQSMCANPYSAKWRHGPHHCPNLVPNQQDHEHFHRLSVEAFGVRVQYDASSQYEFTSLAHLWSEWHQQYWNADYPVLFSKFAVHEKNDAMLRVFVKYLTHSQLRCLFYFCSLGNSSIRRVSPRRRRRI